MPLAAKCPGMEQWTNSSRERAPWSCEEVNDVWRWFCACLTEANKAGV